MKLETLKNWGLALLVAGCAFLLNREKGCTALTRSDDPAPVTVYLPQFDTVIVSIPGTVQVVVRTRTVHDSILIGHPMPVDTPVLILWADQPDSTHLYEGRVETANCNYKYLAGVAGDSLSFLAIEPECTVSDTGWFVSPYVEQPPTVSMTRTNHQAGLKVGWAIDGQLTVGVQYVYKGIYAAATLVPHHPWVFEAGTMIPIGKKHKVILPRARPGVTKSINSKATIPNPVAETPKNQ